MLASTNDSINSENSQDCNGAEEKTPLSEEIPNNNVLASRKCKIFVCDQFNRERSYIFSWEMVINYVNCIIFSAKLLKRFLSLQDYKVLIICQAQLYLNFRIANLESLQKNMLQK